ncbi:CaiB/BaiF CoA transferase family protein [Limibacillus halophilus]
MAGISGRPLEGLRVLDLSRILAGPWATQILADLGAEVIKVERPGTGDDTRSWGPPFAEGEGGASEAAYFLSANRGKKSLALDMKSAEGQALLRRLAEKSDVVIENFKRGDLKRYGLDYESLCALNPKLVYCSLTGFGQTGPYADKAGYDFMIQGVAGLMSVTGLPDGVPGGGPVKVGVALSDVLTGLYSAIAILGALQERSRSGLGQQIDMALFDVTVACLANQSLNYLVSGKPPGRLGNAHPNIVPYQVFAAADGHLIVAVGNDGQFRRLMAVLGEPGLGEEPLYATNRARVENREGLVALLEPLFAAKPRDHWLQALEAAGVPCGAINDLGEVFADPQSQARGLAMELPHATLGEVPSVRSPIRYSRSAMEPQAGPPALGQHSREVLAETLGLSEEEIAGLEAEGVVASS